MIAIRKFNNIMIKPVLWWLVLFVILIVSYMIANKYLVPSPITTSATIVIKQVRNNSENPIEYEPLRKLAIQKFIDNQTIMMELAKKSNWQITYPELLLRIKLQDRAAIPNSFLLTIDTGDKQKSTKFTHDFGALFIESYRQSLEKQNLEAKENCEATIAIHEAELRKLKRQLEIIQAGPVSASVMQDPLTIRKELELNVGAFIQAYGAYIGRLDKMRDALKLELELELQVFAEKDANIQKLRKRLAEVERQQQAISEMYKSNRLDIYNDNDVAPDSSIPHDIRWLYENIRTLKRTESAIVLRELISNEEKALHNEQEKLSLIKKINAQMVCDILVREMNIK